MALLLGCGGAAAGAAPGPVVVLPLRGSIQPGSARYLERGLSEADRRGAELVVVELDTPGGMLVSLREMTGAITSSRPPVAVLVTPAGARAASAGFFLLLAADFAAMAPGTNTGAAHPVALGGRGRDTNEESPSAEKAVSDTAALARALAVQRGRPVALAEQAVRSSRSFSAREALDAGLIDAIASTRGELLHEIDGRTLRRFDGRPQEISLASPSVQVIAPSAGERVLMAISDPLIAYLLLMVGIVGLAVELLHPGFIVPGIVGAISLLLAFYALSVLSVSFIGLALLALGLALLVAEAFVTSFGLLAVAGLACFVLGSLMLFGGRGGDLRLGLAVVLPVALVLGAIVLALASRVVRTQRAPRRTGAQALVGLEGEAVVPLAPTGMIMVQGEYWEAAAPAPVPRGAKVRVVAASGRRLEVEAADGGAGRREAHP